MLIDSTTSISINNRSSLEYYPTNDPSRFVVKLPDSLVFDSNSNWYVGVIQFSHGQIVNNNQISYICIHLDFISNQIIGDKLLKISYMGPITSDGTEVVNHEIRSVRYCRINKLSVSEIQCCLTDEKGEIITFENNDVMTNIVFEIKRKSI